LFSSVSGCADIVVIQEVAVELVIVVIQERRRMGIVIKLITIEE